MSKVIIMGDFHGPYAEEFDSTYKKVSNKQKAIKLIGDQIDSNSMSSLKEVRNIIDEIFKATKDMKTFCIKSE
jgi:predicted phosphodiesterase